MSEKNIEPFLTIPSFSAIPFIRHGFGTAGSTEGDLRKWGAGGGFRLVFLKQIHSDIVRFIDRLPERKLEGDALVTERPGLLLVIKTADCLPVLIVDERRRVIAAVHCGWRGTLQFVLERAVRGMMERYGCRNADLLAGFGPCISGDCYEVGAEVRQSFVGAGFPAEIFRFREAGGNKYLLDLREANLWQLRRLGIPAANIFRLDACTHCDKGYYSYRRDKNSKARMLSFIGMTFSQSFSPISSSRHLVKRKKKD